jgi:hypothetical protein
MATYSDQFGPLRMHEIGKSGSEGVSADVRPSDLHPGDRHLGDRRWVHHLVHGAPGPAQQGAIAFGWRWALREPQDLRFIAAHLLSEGDAFRSFGAVMTVLERLQILSGKSAAASAASTV